MIHNFLPQNLSNTGVESLIVKTSDRFSPFLYVDKKAKFSNKLDIKCHTKTKPVYLRISESYVIPEMLKDLKSIKFEPNTYLPYCGLEYIANPPILFPNHYKIFEYIRDLYIKDNVFLGGGIATSLVESGLYHLFDTNKVAGKKYLEEFFINNNEKLFRYKNEYIAERLGKVLYNVPFFIAGKYLLIRLDGSIKGSIENDYKFWYDDRFSKVKFWKDVKLYDNQFLVLFR